ncbi:efflux RND transporter permease subunit [Sphingobium nicotianae]|uniref:Efflux RND transporter permease subunit n=1 Tax=Sphingobium nicotianae TaxID=2782607 RepID=A0A9X1DGE9_9SPHN|nr:efflux RND transporter permease subunit [Sphingobium nicotianae]MBT2189429.1 efflux RND transporter permease subunit [Sphingobium nicotianae]
MLTFIVRHSLRFPWLVMLLAALLLVFGVQVVRSAAYDVFPEFVPPQATVQTEARGYVAEQVEALVTRPLESIINGANGVESVRSESIQGLSVISITFKEGSDPYRARQQVSEALADASSQLPSGVGPPVITPLTSSTMDLLKIGFVSDKMSPMELRDLVQWTVRPRLLAARGVARANVYGGQQRRIEVRVRPADLLAHDLSLADVATATQHILQINGGGFADTPNQRILIEPDSGSLSTQAIARTVLASGSGGGGLHIGDVADVVEAPMPAFGDALVMGKPGVLLTLSSQYGANTLDATKAVEAGLTEIVPALKAKGVTVYPAMHRPANFIETALSGIQRDLLIGAAMIAVVLLLFMRDLRVAAITFLSIPLSLLAALTVLHLAGQTINTMTLGGLAVALGVVIDDAIVDIENIVRRLRGVEETDDRRAIIEHASIEVRGPVVYATFVLALTIMPILFLTGLQGAFFAPLALSFLLAVLASLIVAMTVTPALALLLLGRSKPHDEPALLGRFKDRHQAIAEMLFGRPGAIAIGVGTIGLVAVLGAATFGSELLPSFRERHYVVGVHGPVGASFDWMRRTGQRISKQLLAIPEVLSIEEQMGRAEAGEDTWEPNVGEFHVRLRAVGGAGEDAAQEKIRAVLEGTPALQSEVTTFLGDRIGESLSGETSAVVVSVQGGDLDTLDRVANQVAAQLKATPNAADVQVQMQPGTPILRIALDPERMALHGVDPANAGEAIDAVFEGVPAGQLSLADRTVGAAVVVPPEFRQDPEAVGEMLVRGTNGQAVRLADISTIALEEGRAAIAHDAGQRRQVVTANVTGSDVSGFVTQAKQRIAANIHLPGGVYLSWGGQAEGQGAAARQLAGNVALAAIAIIALLILAFGGVRPALLIIAGMPLALAGGVIAVWFGGGILSLGALVGFVTLFGISARNSILLISHADHLVREEGANWSRDTVLRATRERVAPIMMTALVTAFGLAPLALESGQAGREVQGPMAMVILGGLVSSLVLTLLLLPALTLRWRFRNSHD